MRKFECIMIDIPKSINSYKILKIRLDDSLMDYSEDLQLGKIYVLNNKAEIPIVMKMWCEELRLPEYETLTV